MNVNLGERIVKRLLLLATCLILGACNTPPGGVGNKVLADFGLRDRPEGYVSGADQVMERLEDVGATEIRRLNLRERHGQVKAEQDGLQMRFYKEVKVYEDARPTDARAVTSGPAGRDRGYSGFVEYTYQMYQSPRHPTRVEAEAASATIPSGDSGREVYRYRFSSGGTWDGAQGELSR